MGERLTTLGRVNGQRMASARAGESRFIERVWELLERTEYRRCDGGEDLEDIYRLRYKSYRSNDMVPESQNGAIHDDLDDVANVHRFGVYVDQQLVSTLRIHVLDRKHTSGPSTSAFGDIVLPMIDQGLTFIDPSRFAADPEWSRVYPQIPYLTLRLAGMACFHFRAPYCLSTVREDHAGFYRRIYYSERIAEPRPYPGVYNRVVLYRADVNAIRERSFQRFPFFRSTETEQRLMFGPARMGEPAPLTILPTAKYLLHAA